MNKLTFRFEPGPDAVTLAAHMILRLLTRGEPGAPRPSALQVHTLPTGQLEIIAEYPPRPLVSKAKGGRFRRYPRAPARPDRRN